MIGTRIRRQRILAQISLYTVAAQGGPSVERMGDIERGIGRPLTLEEADQLRRLKLYPSEMRR